MYYKIIIGENEKRINIFLILTNFKERKNTEQVVSDACDSINSCVAF